MPGLRTAERARAVQLQDPPSPRSPRTRVSVSVKSPIKTKPEWPQASEVLHTASAERARADRRRRRRPRRRRRAAIRDEAEERPRRFQLAVETPRRAARAADPTAAEHAHAQGAREGGARRALLRARESRHRRREARDPGVGELDGRDLHLGSRSDRRARRPIRLIGSGRLRWTGPALRACIL